MTFHTLEERFMQADRLKHLERLSPEKRELVLKKLRQQENSPAVKNKNGLPPIIHDPDNDYRPLSFSQQRLWFLQQLDENNAAYNMPLAIRLTGRLDITALEKSLIGFIERHETLRTTFFLVDGDTTQRIAPVATLFLPVVDLQTVSFEQQKAEIQRLTRQEAEKPFDLAVGPLYRTTLLRLYDQEHILLLTLHHIICDGWSINILVQEIGTLYAAYSQGKPASLPPLPIQYVDYARWQREWLTGEMLEKQLAYWKEQMTGATGTLNLPLDHVRPPVQTFPGSVRRFRFNDPLLTQIKLLSQQTQTTMFMTLLAAFSALLYRYSGQDDILIGTPIANRQHKVVEPLVGFFVNTLVIRSRIKPGMTFRELLAQVQQVSLDAYTHQDLVFEKLVEELQLTRTLSHSPLFQVMFILQNTPTGKLTLPGLTLEPLPLEHTTAKFDLTMGLTETGGSLAGWVEYNTDLFEMATIDRLINCYQTLLAGITANPEQSVANLPLMTDEEREQLLVTWNQTTAVHSPSNCLQQLVAVQAQTTPEATAVTYQEQTLSYRELEQQANQLAHHLHSLGMGPETVGLETPVGICLHRSPQLLVALLGVLKAGGAYVPLDPAYPQERLRYMLADSQAQVLLTETALQAELPDFSSEVVCLDSQWKEISHYPEDAPPSAVTPDHLAYIIYTSGSTGQPKGTMITHRGLINYLTWCCQAYGVAEGNGSLVHSSIGFDATITSLFAPLLVGKQVTLLPEDREIEALAAALSQDKGYGLVKITPAHLDILSQLLSAEGRDHNTAFIIGGEALMGQSLWVWQQMMPQARLVNEYGPTETVVGCCVYEVPSGAEVAEGAVPIGRPIANTRLYILDNELQPVPVGVPGELFVGGAGVARGYRQQPGLTADKFIPDPFSRQPGARLYRTGDMVSYLPDGNIIYLGRADNQVKIRGFRVELGEIESVLAGHPAVRETVVMAREDRPGDKQLVAYCVPEAETMVSPKEMRAFLRAHLPDYMLPAAFVNLPALPLTNNGKIDRKALPIPDKAASSVMEEYTPPDTPTEVALVAIWSDVLAIPQIGIHDNFFALGGHSLLAVRIIAQMEERFELEVPIRNLFENPTIAELAENIDKLHWTLEQLSSIPIEADEEREEFVL